MTAAANKALVLAFYRLMNERRFGEMWELCAPDGLWGGGRAATDDFAPIERMKAVIVDPMPVFVGGGIQFTVHSLTAEDDRVAAEVESYAPLVNGNVYNNHYHMLFVIRDGKIAIVKEYADTAHVARCSATSAEPRSARRAGGFPRSTRAGPYALMACADASLPWSRSSRPGWPSSWSGCSPIG